MNFKLMYNVGLNENKYPTILNGVRVKQYRLWSSLLTRCYSDVYHSSYPAYIDCYASENFKNYSYFYEWCEVQVGFNQPDFHLDKDLLIKGNKVYSEDTCVFLPSEINRVFLKNNIVRGKYPVGVVYVKRRGIFEAKINKGKTRKHLGYFKTPEEAFRCYKIEKELHIKSLAEKWKHLIDDRAYNALMKYEVEIDD